MTQDEVLRVIKAIIRKKSKLHVARRQIFLTKHVALPGGVDRFFFGVTVDRHARAWFIGGMVVEWATSVAGGLAPTPTGVLAPAISASSAAGGWGGKTPAAIDGKLTGAYNSGLKALTPAAEGTPHQYAINGSYLAMQKAADNVGIYGILDVTNGAVRWRVTDDVKQYILWSDNLSDRPDLMDHAETMALGAAAGKAALSIGGSWVTF